MRTTAEPCVIVRKTPEEKYIGTDITEESESRPGIDVEVESWHREAIKLLDFAGSRKIESAADLALAADDLAVIVRLKKAMAERKRFYTGPFSEKIKAIDETYGELMAPAEAAEKIMRKKMGDCRAKQERLHKETIETA